MEPNYFSLPHRMKPQIRSQTHDLHIFFGRKCTLVPRTALVTRSFKRDSDGTKRGIWEKHAVYSWYTTKVRAEEIRRNFRKPLWNHEK